MPVEETLMITPLPRGFMTRMAAWQPKKTPLRLMASTRSSSASVTSETRPSLGTPATLHMMSTAPKASTPPSTRASTADELVTSTPMATARPPCDVI